MKRKNYIFSLALALLMGTMTMSLTACSSEDIVANNTQQPAQGEVRTYTVSIPATIGDDEAQTRAVDFSGTDAVTGKPTAIATFATTDKIYVYKKSPSPAWLSWNSETSNFDYLSPNKAGTNCTLTGTITGQFAVGDVLELYYNMNYPDIDPANCMFVCVNQDGTASGVPDFAVATVKVKSIDDGIITFCQESDDTDETAHFENQLSMFRLSFTDGSNSISVKRVKITSDNDAIFSTYLPMESPALYVPTYSRPIIATLPAPTTDYIYVGIGINENKSSVGAVMNFEVEDADGKVYTGTKAAPAAGFAKGKYYYSTSPVTVAYQFTRQSPTITWTTPSTPVEPDMYNIYDIDDDNFDITLSGTSNGYGFYGNSNGTVSLNGLTASYYDNEFFIYQWGDLTINLLNGSSNSITCPNTGYCISVDGTLKLSGNGTLTVTANSNSCGLRGDSNYNDSSNDYETTTELDVTSQLAAPGHTVTRSARMNVGGTYTWTYTVTPLSTPFPPLYAATEADHGKVVCAAGHLHPAKTIVPTGCTAVGILGKVTGTGHGLILALHKARNQSWNTIDGWASKEYASTTLKALPDDELGRSLTNNYTRLGSTTVSGWAVAQKDDYVAIFKNLGSTKGDSKGEVYDANVNAYITGAGGDAITEAGWSASGDDNDNAWYFAGEYWISNRKKNSNSIWPVLGF